MEQKDKNKSRIKTKSKILVLGLILVMLTGIFGMAGNANAQANPDLPSNPVPNNCYYRGAIMGSATPGSTPITDSNKCKSAGGTWYTGIIPPPGGTDPNQMVNCKIVSNGMGTVTQVTRAQCIAAGGQEVTTPPSPGYVPPTPPSTPDQNALQEEVAKLSCASLIVGNVEPCLVKLAYYIFYVVPGFLLGVVANFFNVIVSLALSSVLYDNDFIPAAWTVVRDISNIFFLLVLLYVGVQTILGLGHGTKKIIAQVVIMALLINFSMFFTKIVIDASNILALVFYNKIDVSTSVNGAPRTYLPIMDPAKTGIVEKDLSGGIVSAFDATKLLSPDFFDKARKNTQVVPSSIGALAYIGGGAVVGSVIPVIGTVTGAVAGGVAYGVKSIVGYAVGTDDVPYGLMLGIILVAGFILLFAIYAFTVASISFLARLIELWILIIASPFAFMSLSVPMLEGIDFVGWKSWKDHVLKTSFMAPVFLFMLYLIFLLVKTPIFDTLAERSQTNQTTLEALVLFILPAAIILTLLLKASSYAKKGAGKLGEIFTKGANVVQGLALGAATGGAATLARASLGRAGAAVSNSAWAKRLETSGVGVRGLGAISKWTGARVRDVGNVAKTSSFDVRGVKIMGKDLSSVAGSSVGHPEKGGWDQMRKTQVENRMKRAKELEIGEDEGLKQNLNNFERDRQELLRAVSHEIEELDKRIKTARDNAKDAAGRASADPGGFTTDPLTGVRVSNADAARDASNRLNDLKRQKSAIKNGRVETATDGVTQYDGSMHRINGNSINDLEDNLIPHAHNEIEQENRTRKWAMANNISGIGSRAWNTFWTGGTYSMHRGVNEAAHKIRMEAKLDSGTKDSGGH